jgi:hypothetical protein
MLRAVTVGNSDFVITGSKKEVLGWMESHQNLKVYSAHEGESEFQATWGGMPDDNAGHVLTEAYGKAAQIIFPGVFSSTVKRLAKKLWRSSDMDYHVTLTNQVVVHRMGAFNDYPIETTIGAVLSDIKSMGTFTQVMTKANEKVNKVKGIAEALGQ